MQHRVTAILLAHSGAEYLEVTLAALQGQTVAPDFVVGVDLSSTDRSEGTARRGARDVSIVTVPNKSTFGDAVSRALLAAPADAADSEWLWLLGHDNAPRPDALERLLDAVADTPAVSIAGPKLMRWDAPDTIAEFGESLSRFGSSIRLVEGELDQAQHDAQADVLGDRGRWHARAPLGVGLTRWIRPGVAVGGCLARLLCSGDDSPGTA